MATTNDIKNGSVLNIDGQLWNVVEFQHVTPGKGGAFVRTKLKNVVTGKVVDRTYNAGAKIDIENVAGRDRGRRRRLPAREPGRHDRDQQRQPALRRAARVRRARGHLHGAGPAGR